MGKVLNVCVEDKISLVIRQAGGAFPQYNGLFKREVIFCTSYYTRRNPKKFRAGLQIKRTKRRPILRRGFLKFYRAGGARVGQFAQNCTFLPSGSGL